MRPLVADALIDWGWVSGHRAEIWSQFVQHLYLTALAVGIGFLISFPMAVFAHRHRRVYAPVTFVTGLLYTIPSLALFVLLIPPLHLSVANAEVALVSYTLLILIRNIVAGLDGVPEDAKEAARGMGYTERQLLWRVELPLALPVIVAGIRIATVTTIGLVTVSSFIGLGGEGRFILRGLRDFFPTPTIVGSTLSVFIALAADGVLLGTQRLLTPWSRPGRGVRAFR